MRSITGCIIVGDLSIAGLIGVVYVRDERVMRRLHAKTRSSIQGVPKKVSIKKLLFGAAQGLNLQFLNLFGFSISVSFVWCII